MHPPQLLNMGAEPILAPDSVWERDATMKIGLYCSVLPTADGGFQVRAFIYHTARRLRGAIHARPFRPRGLAAQADLCLSYFRPGTS